MAQPGCPVTLAYLHELKVERQSLGCANAVEWKLLALNDMAEVAGCYRTEVLLRSFLALEVMATRGLKGDPVLGKDTLTAMRWTRSARGLTTLLHGIRVEIDELRADFTERIILDKSSAASAEDLLYTKKEWRLEGLLHFEAAAVLTRRALKATDVWRDLSRIGTYLAYVLSRSCGFEARLDVAHELLEQTSEKVRRAWEPRILSVQ